MPTVGECQVCGEKYTMLFMTVLEKTDGSGLRFVMCCWRCKEYFKEKRREKHGQDGMGGARG